MPSGSLRGRSTSPLERHMSRYRLPVSQSQKGVTRMLSLPPTAGYAQRPTAVMFPYRSSVPCSFIAYYGSSQSLRPDSSTSPEPLGNGGTRSLRTPNTVGGRTRTPIRAVLVSPYHEEKRDVVYLLSQVLERIRRPPDPVQPVTRQQPMLRSYV